MRILTFSNLFPNAVNPRHGIFVEQRLKRLAATGRVQSVVVSPVPWFPFSAKLFGSWGDFARVPKRDARDGMTVHYPRYPLIPRFGMSTAPLLMAGSMKRPLRRIQEQGFDFDVIDAHYFYPDGVAATLLGRWLRKPVVVSARGSDINVLPKYAIARGWIRWAIEHCDSIIAVSEALGRKLCELGASQAKVTVLRNGVDLEVFRPLDRERIRRSLNVRQYLFLSVGNLVPEKGHDIAIRALAGIPGAELLIVGSGPSREPLRQLASAAGVSDRVRFLDNMPQSELVRYYTAADALILASVSEGMPNVVLEAIACGTPVVATAVGGTAEIVRTPEAGLLLKERSEAQLMKALGNLIEHPPNRDDTRRYAETLAWDDVIRKQIEVYESVATNRTVVEV